jgi:hypothetical protein
MSDRKIFLFINEVPSQHPSLGHPLDGMTTSISALEIDGNGNQTNFFAADIADNDSWESLKIEDTASTKTAFRVIADPLRQMIGDKPVVSHHADYDIKLLNAGFSSCGLPPVQDSQVIDSLEMARKIAPNLPKSLIAVSIRLGLIDSSDDIIRISAPDLARAYYGMLDIIESVAFPKQSKSLVIRRSKKEIKPSEDEIERHAAHLALLKNPIWRTYT